MSFTVTNIIDSNTIQVAPGWKWEKYEGALVKIKGYVSSPASNPFTISKLKALILNKPVELKNPTMVNTIPANTIECSVILNGIDVAQYFPELKEHS